MNAFTDILSTTAQKSEITLSLEQLEKFNDYYEILIEWNEKMNLTALTQPSDVALKHFCDSLLLLKYCDIPKNSSVIDVGTGAGFPSVPLKIVRPDIRLCLVDSLNKRTVFLSELAKKLDFDNYSIVHSRAEDLATDKDYRQSFDFAVSRAVASLNVLSEYCLPFVKLGGAFIAMKGKDTEEEINTAKQAIKTLGGKIEKVEIYSLIDSSERAVIKVKKISDTPLNFPRRPGKIKQKPL